MLRFIFSKKIIVLLVLAGVIYVLAFPYRTKAQTWFSPVMAKVQQLIKPQTINSTTGSLKTLAERGVSLASESGDLLNNVVGVNQQEATKSLTERTIDYAQYRYCKQVVDEWDRRSASPTGGK